MLIFKMVIEVMIVRNKEYEVWKRKVKLKGQEKRIPVCGQFELTARCTLDCKMCYVHNQDSNACKDRELTTQQWKRIFDEAFDLGMMFATVTGGECLLRDDFKELYLHLWNKRVIITVFTNGTLLNDEHIDFFKKYQPDTVRITLYGSSEAGYQAVTGHRGFERVTNNIEKLRSAGINVEVGVTPSKYSVNDYVETIKYIYDSGFDFKLSEMILSPKRDEPERDDHYLSIDEIVDLSVRRTKLFAEPTPREDIPPSGGPLKEPPRYGMPCNGGTGSFNVTWDGMMYPCANAMIGGVSLLEMCCAEAWKKIRITADQVVQGVECIDCPYDSVCPKCPTYRLLDLQSGHCNPAVCEMTRRLVAAGVKKLEEPQESCE